MAVNYKIANRADPTTQENGKEHSSPMAVVKDILAGLLKEDKIVQAGTIGTFYPVVKFKKNLAEKTGKPEDMELTVRFRASQDFKEKLSDGEMKMVKG